MLYEGDSGSFYDLNCLGRLHVTWLEKSSFMCMILMVVFSEERMSISSVQFGQMGIFPFLKISHILHKILLAVFSEVRMAMGFVLFGQMGIFPFLKIALILRRCAYPCFLYSLDVVNIISLIFIIFV